jgi:hypothetical protein
VPVRTAISVAFGKPLRRLMSIGRPRAWTVDGSGPEDSRIGSLTTAAQDLVLGVWIGLCEVYPTRSLLVEARSVAPAPFQEFVEIAVTDRGRVVTQRVPSAAVTPPRLRELRDALLRAFCERLGPSSAEPA